MVSHTGAGQAYVRLPCVSSNLWQSKVDTKRRILVLELRFQLVDCALEHLRAHANAPNDANAALTPNSATNVHGAGGEHTAFVTAAASLGPAATYVSLSSTQHFRRVIGSGTDVHPRKHNRVVDPE